MDLKSGLIEINGEIFTPGYTFENFQKSTFFGRKARRRPQFSKR